MFSKLTFPSLNVPKCGKDGLGDFYSKFGWKFENSKVKSSLLGGFLHTYKLNCHGFLQQLWSTRDSKVEKGGYGGNDGLADFCSKFGWKF